MKFIISMQKSCKFGNGCDRAVYSSHWSITHMIIPLLSRIFISSGMSLWNNHASYNKSLHLFFYSPSTKDYQTATLTLEHMDLSLKILVSSLCVYYSYCIESSLFQFSNYLMHAYQSISLSQNIILSNIFYFGTHRSL